MQQTKLIMPYAGITQSNQYVFSRRKDIGFRFHCLGRCGDTLPNEVDQIWRTAPVVYEFCSPDQFNLDLAHKTLEVTHGSLVHNNGYLLGSQDLQRLMVGVGYRYILNNG